MSVIASSNNNLMLVLLYLTYSKGKLLKGLYNAKSTC